MASSFLAAAAGSAVNGDQYGGASSRSARKSTASPLITSSIRGSPAGLAATASTSSAIRSPWVQMRNPRSSGSPLCG